MSTSRIARAVTLAALLSFGVGLAACNTTPSAAPRTTNAKPGAQLRTLNLQAKAGWRATFEATFLYTAPVSVHATRTERFTVAQDGSKLLFKLGGAEEVNEGGDEAYYCHLGQCVPDSFYPSIQPPTSFYVLRSLANGSTFWSTTQGYPISVADLATRGIGIAFSSATYASQPSSCVTITYRSGPDGYPLRSDAHKRQSWCLTKIGVVDHWSAGRRDLVLISFKRSPPAADFELPKHDTVAYPK
jgi:hypothetical protein